MRWRGIEPRSPAWQARILPLNHQRQEYFQLFYEPDKISKFGVIHTGISDNSLIYGIRKTNINHKDNGNIITIRNMRKFDEGKFLYDLGCNHGSMSTSLQTILALCGKFGKIFSCNS